MNLIKLNTPDYFAEKEADDLNKYLDKEINGITSYSSMELSSEVVE